MGSFNRFAAFSVAVLLASLLGCAATIKHEGTGEYIDDTIATTKVKLVFNEPSLKSSDWAQPMRSCRVPVSMSFLSRQRTPMAP